MSQVSYGTITIVDTTDIERIYMVYAKSVSNTIPPSDELTWSESIASAPGEGDFIWQKTVVEKAITEEKTYSDPVCVTGSSGQGVEKIINYYCNYGQGQPEEDYSGWQLEIPEYDENKPNYWTKVVVIYSDDTRKDFQASGTIATFESEKAGIFDSLEVNLSPIQDLHGYDKPWVGGAGRNLLNIGGRVNQTWASVRYTSEDDFVTMNGTKNGGGYANLTQLTITLPAGTYYTKAFAVSGTATNNISVYPFDGNADVAGNIMGSEKSFTLSEEKTFYFRFAVWDDGTVFTNYKVGIVISKTSGIDKFYPYSNICPISGWDEVETHKTGKNLLPLVEGDMISGGWNRGFPNPINQAGTYTISCENAFGGTGVGGASIVFANDVVYASPIGSLVTAYAFGRGTFTATFTVTEEQTKAPYIVFRCGSVGCTYASLENAHIQIELGTTATSYEPYDGQTITTDLPQTVYGGTLDVVNGTLTVDRVAVDMGSLDWYYNGTIAGGAQYAVSITGKKAGETNFICSAYETHTQTAEMGYICGRASTSVVAVNTPQTTVAEFKQSVTGQTICYELATPTSYSLTPQEVQTLLGSNNVWSDGTVELRGHTISKRDVMIYKDNGLTDVVNKSAEANTNAAEALEKANDGIVSTTQLWYQTNSTSAPSVPASHSQVDQGTVTYNNWRSARPNNNVDSYKYYYYCYEYLHGDGTYTYSAEAILDTSNLSQYQIGALTTKVKNFWWDSNGAHVASGKNGNEVTTNTISTYGYHALMGLTGISFNYDSAKVVDLNSTTPSLDFYTPPVISGSTVTEGNKTMMLSANALKFYNPTDGTTEQAVLDTNGLILKKGGVRAGTANQSGFIYLSTEPYGNYSINGSTSISDWKQIIGTKFGVTADGTLYASNTNIQGILTAGAGSTIGPWTVGNNAIYNPSTKSSFNSDTVNGVYIGIDGIALGQGIFKVGADGVLDASGVSVSGDLTATNGFTVAQNNKTLTSITTNGMIVYDGNGTADSNIVAKFTNSGAQIGQTGNSYISLTDKYMRLYGQNWNRLTSETVPYVEFIDLRTGTTNTTTIVEKFKGTGSQVKFRLSMSVYSQIIEVKVDDLITDVTMPESDSFQFNTAPTEDSLIVATYQTSDNTAKAFTLGYRGEDSDIGGMSTVIGYNNEASSIYSYASGYYTKASAAYAHAEGNYTKATDIASHAEGSHTIASGEAAHAEGVLGEASGDAAHAEGVDTYAFGRASHAEGEGTKASGYSSHAEGWKTEASGFWYGYSHAQNEGTIAAMDAQTAIGTYNIEDEETDGYEGSTHPIKDAGDGTYGNNYGKYAFIIGNGWSGNRSNALTVDWSGNVNIASGALYHVNGVPISDFVIEQGTSGNWSYRKYNSGTYEAWYTGTNAFAIDGRFSSSSPVLYYGAIQNLSLPFAVTSIQYVDVKAFYSSWGVWTAITQADSSGIKYQSFSAVARTSVTYAIRGYIKGTYSLT